MELLQLLQAGGAAAQLLASGAVVGQLALGLLNGRLGRLQGLPGAPEGRLAAQVAAAGGEGFRQQGVEATGELLVLGRLHGAAAALLQLAHQGVQVVVGAALGEEVVAGAALHHP